MAGTSIVPLSSPMPRLNISKNHWQPARINPSYICFAAAAPESSEKPVIELEFIEPKAGDPVEKATAMSGEKLLRSVMSDAKIELYATYGKVMNCGGGGSCGTCIVEIIDGKDLLNERTNTELRYLKKKLESWRLTCQTIVGNKENCGKTFSMAQPHRSLGPLAPVFRTPSRPVPEYGGAKM